ncbi:MAG: hypothetical protein ACI4PF_02275 [Christensenellales bacterium]
MSEKLLGLIELMNAKEIKAFEKLTPRQKSMTIYRDFENYYKFQSRAFNAKTEEEKDRCYFEVERNFVKANKEIKMLSEDELGTYIKYAQSRILKAIDGHNEDRYSSYKLLFGTIIRQMPKELNDKNLELFNQLQDCVAIYEDTMSLS